MSTQEPRFPDIFVFTCFCSMAHINLQDPILPSNISTNQDAIKAAKSAHP